MSNTMREVKKSLRRSVIEARDKLSQTEIKEKSQAIAEKFCQLESFQKADTIMFFLSFGSEVDTWPLIEKSFEDRKTVVVPRPEKKEKKLIPSQLINWEEDLTPGVYGILEPLPEKTRPVDPQKIDLLVVPGVAFDINGNRLGYGGGYYDRFFERLRSDVPLAAIAFEIQMVDEVPVTPWDRKVDLLITEDRVIYF